MSALKDLEKNPINNSVRDKSNDEELLKDIFQDSHELSKKPEDFPNTQVRVNAVGSYLNGDGTYEEVANKIGRSADVVADWVQIYADYGIDGLKAMEGFPLFKSRRDISNDKELLDTLRSEYNNLLTTSSNKFPKTLQRAKAIIYYLESEKTTLTDVKTKTGFNRTSINHWVFRYHVGGMKGLKHIEKFPLEISPDNTRTKKEILATVRKDIRKLRLGNSPQKFPETLKRLRAYRSYLRDGGTLKENAEKVGLGKDALIKWKKMYDKNGLKEAKKREQFLKPEYRSLTPKTTSPTTVFARMPSTDSFSKMTKAQPPERVKNGKRNTRKDDDSSNKKTAAKRSRIV